MSSANIIDTSTPEIVLTERQIKMSDERLKRIIRETYERAQRTQKSATYRERYSSLFSISGTLLLTQMTSTFHSIGPINQAFVTSAVWAIIVLCAIVGLIFLWLHTTRKNSLDVDDRDNIVQEILSENLQDSITKIVD